MSIEQYYLCNKNTIFWIYNTWWQLTEENDYEGTTSICNYFYERARISWLQYQTIMKDLVSEENVVLCQFGSEAPGTKIWYQTSWY